MSEKSYRVVIEDNVFIRVYFFTKRGRVNNYLVKLMIIYSGIEYEVVRFDSHHKRAHMDILYPDGSTQRKVWLSVMNNDDALTNAINDIEKNYDIYVERFKKWLRRKKQS